MILHYWGIRWEWRICNHATKAAEETKVAALCSLIYAPTVTGTCTIHTPVSVTDGSTPAYVLVADSPDVVYEFQKASFTATDVGTSGGFDFTGGAGGDASTGCSAMYLTDTATGVVQVLGLVIRPDNETGSYAKVLARITNNNYAL